MMDRNREARRGAMAAVNGGGLSRRRQQRTTNLRDSPEEDGAMEMQQEPSRLRDRGIKKDRDRDRERSSRSKRRRGERSMHSNREEGDDSSEESMDDEDDDDEEDASVTVRLPASASNSAQIPSSSSSIQLHNHHHAIKRTSFSANNNGKPVRPPAPSWKVAEEMIGVSIPRKARSSSLKRPQDCGDVIHRQASTSPARPSPSSTTAVSPSSSNASIRKKKVSSGTKQHRPPKIAKSSSAASSIQEIEIEVAEVLYGMTRQALPLVNKQDDCSRDTEAKSSVCSPNSISLQQSNFPSSSLPMVATAPKRKRPRLKFDEERPASPSTKTVSEIPAKTEEVSSPKSEKNTLAFPAVENGVGSCDTGDAQQDLAKPGSCNQVLDSKSSDCGEEGMKKEDVAISSSKPMEASCADTNINREESPAAAKVENFREEKFSIDLMAPPLPEKSSSDKDGILDFVSDNKSLGLEKKMLPTLDIAIGETEKAEKVAKQEGTSEHTGNFLAQDFDLKKQTLKEKVPNLQLDLGKHDKDGLSLSGGSKQQQQQVSTQQQKPARIDPKQEKLGPLTSMPLPVPMAGWPGGFPSFGYMGQVPSLQAVVPMDGSVGAVKTVQQPPQPPHFLQPQMRPKRCATHCYIAQNIHCHQQIARMHPFWPAAAVNVAKQYNLNAVPPLDSAAILGNPLQGGFPPPRISGPLQDKSAPSVAMACTVPPPKKKSSATPASASNGNTFMEGGQRKQFLLPQSSQPGSSVPAPPNMIHGPAFLFPINQQPAVASRSGAPSKPAPPTGNAAPSAATSASSAAAGSGAAGHSATTMSFNYAGLEAQYMTILQNNAILPNVPYPFPLAAGHVGGPPPFRGTAPAQAMPFFNGPFYSSQMVPSQQQQQQLMQQHQQQHNHQNPSTSSGSSSSQKHNTQQSQQQQQQQRVPGSSNSHSFPTSKQPLHLLPHQGRQLEIEATYEDSPSTADSSRASQAQKGIYGQNFAMPIHSQNFALISPAPTAGGSHGENKQPPVVANQHQTMKVDLTPSQAYAMSFASFGGSAAAAAATAAAAAAPGLNFSAIVQNPAMLQNLPEVARHGYHPAVAMAAAAAHHKKSHHEDGKSAGETMAVHANASVADDGKTAGVTTAAKSVAQHSLSFSRPDNDSASITMSNHADSSRALNLLHPSVNGAQASNPTSTSPSTAVTNPSSTLPLPLSQSKQQYYQQMLHFQHQHSQQQQQQQRMLYMQHQQHQQPPLQQQLPSQQQQQSMQLHHQQMLLQQQMVSRQQMMTRTGKLSSAHNNTNSSSNISSTTMPARFPQGGLAGFPPSLIQGGSNSASQSPQWKNASANRAATPAPASSATSSSSSAKNQIPQQQQPPKQQQQQPLLNPNAHHTQISFGVSASSNKPSISSPAAASAINTGSPQNSVSKSSTTAGGGGNGGSPRASSASKALQPPASVLPALPLQQQQASAKNSSSAAVSSLKPSSPITNSSSSNNNRNMTTSILGHPHVTPANSSSGKKLQSHQHQSQKQQPFQQPQLFFNNPYIQAQSSQRRQTEQPNSTTTATSGMVSLSPASLTLAGGASATSDPAKVSAAAVAASNIKGLTTQQQQQAGILQHSTQFAPATSMSPNPFMSAAFNYVQVMPSSSVSVKPASAAATPEQKQSTTTGNENVRACWKPEKR